MLWKQAGKNSNTPIPDAITPYFKNNLDVSPYIFLKEKIFLDFPALTKYILESVTADTIHEFSIISPQQHNTILNIKIDKNVEEEQEAKKIKETLYYVASEPLPDNALVSIL